MSKHLRVLLYIVLTVAILLGGMTFAPTRQAEASGTCARTHVVQAGQNLFRIGLLYGVRWDTLQAWNGLPNANQLYAGQILCVSGAWSGGTTTPPPASPIVVYPGNPFGPTTQPRVFFPSVTLGQKFELRGYNFPANRTVTISLTTLDGSYQPYYTATTDYTGQFYVLVNIPAGLQTAYTVAVLATTTNGYYAKNWFYNR
jgi:hypothetical protein